jgi:hypothetical protein
VALLLLLGTSDSLAPPPSTQLKAESTRPAAAGGVPMEPCGACGRSAGGGHAVCAACVRREVEEARAEMAEALEKNRVLRGRAQAALESRALQPRRCDAEGRAAALDETLRAKILSVSQKVAYGGWVKLGWAGLVHLSLLSPERG